MWINRDYFRILKKVRLDQNQNSNPSNEMGRNQARIRLYSNPDSDPENQKKRLATTLIRIKSYGRRIMNNRWQ